MASDAADRVRRGSASERVRNWLGLLPLQRRVGYLTTAAVAVAVALASLAGWMTVRASLYSSLDGELVDVAASLKWSPPGGTVRVQLEGNRLRVADEGPGIAEEDLPRVFDRFFRADTARTTPGTGLGLSIVAQVVRQHGGVIRAGRSAQGGAEFTMVLPGAHSLEALEPPPPD
jgi:K+-sensing histidine kinase KdpD